MWREEIPHLGNFWASGQPWRHPGCLLPLAAGEAHTCENGTRNTDCIRRAACNLWGTGIPHTPAPVAWQAPQPEQDEDGPKRFPASCRPWLDVRGCRTSMYPKINGDGMVGAERCRAERRSASDQRHWSLPVWLWLRRAALPRAIFSQVLSHQS